MHIGDTHKKLVSDNFGGHDNVSSPKFFDSHVDPLNSGEKILQTFWATVSQFGKKLNFGPF